MHFISSEVFQIVSVEGSKVKINGFHFGGHDVPKIILSVKEDRSGIPEPPRFRTKKESKPVGCKAGMLIKTL